MAIIYSILGHPVFLNSRQEAALAFSERMYKKWKEEEAAEKKAKEEEALQNALHMMEERQRHYPMVEQMRKSIREEIRRKNAPKHHAWEYEEFKFFHNGIEYIYSKGDIINPNEIEEFDIL